MKKLWILVGCYNNIRKWINRMYLRLEAFKVRFTPQQMHWKMNACSYFGACFPASTPANNQNPKRECGVILSTLNMLHFKSQTLIFIKCTHTSVSHMDIIVKFSEDIIITLRLEIEHSVWWVEKHQDTETFLKVIFLLLSFFFQTFLSNSLSPFLSWLSTFPPPSLHSFGP